MVYIASSMNKLEFLVLFFALAVFCQSAYGAQEYAIVQSLLPAEHVGAGTGLYNGLSVLLGGGATFGIVPLIRKSVTGQIAGSVGAYGNVGGVIYLLIYSLSNAQTLFYSMGITALICASLCAFFLEEPQSSFVTESPEKIAASTENS